MITADKDMVTENLSKYVRMPLATYLIFLTAVSGGLAATEPEPSPRPQDTRACVVLLHGLGRTYRSLRTIAAGLEKAGFKTVNIGYPSRRRPIEALAMEAIPKALEQCQTASCDTIHFVTHSMGGLLVRYYLSRHPFKNLGRVVMLGPPNRGSELADTLQQHWFYRWLNGPAGRQLSTGPTGIAASLGPVTYPVGIITGNAPTIFDRRFSNRISGENDGKVSVEHAKVQGMTDFLVLPYSHTFIMEEEETIAQTIQFLRMGQFNKNETPR
ncbi:MAG: alpha/beta fold hydrolase [Desulfobacteraceae bacterium]|nr:alpha/beta fold hydrolase [Desulfobacteraceae bacterium]